MGGALLRYKAQVGMGLELPWIEWSSTVGHTRTQHSHLPLSWIAEMAVLYLAPEIKARWMLLLECQRKKGVVHGKAKGWSRHLANSSLGLKGIKSVSPWFCNHSILTSSQTEGLEEFGSQKSYHEISANHWTKRVHIL